MVKSRHALSRNQKIILRVESIAAGGQGVCKHEGVPIFVDRAAPGDLAEIELYDVRKDFAHAKIVRILESSPARHEPPCKLFKVCGGCQWQHIRYESQLDLKTDIVKQVIQRIAGFDPEIVHQAIGTETPLQYRNKVQFPVAQPNQSTRILAGYYKEGSHELVNIKHCPVQPEPLDILLEMAKEAAEIAGLAAYREKDHSGLLRHLIFRYSFSEDTALLTLVLNAHADEMDELGPDLEEFVFQMTEAESPLRGICVNFNPDRGNRIMGNETECIYGDDHIVEILRSRHSGAPERLKEGLRFQLSPASFFQVNSGQAVTLLDLVLDAVLEYKSNRNLERVPLILDAFAGVATIALWLAPLAERVIAVEEVPDSITDAAKILEINSVENVDLIEGTVEEVFPQLVHNQTAANIVVLDPPRKGVDRDALISVTEMRPERIIYVSCNPATLARDLKILEGLEYRTLYVKPLDIFPQTYHVESVAVLDRVSS